MKITKLRLITGLLIAISCLFMAGVLFNIEMLSNFSKAFILPLLVYLYFTVSNARNKFFAMFLIFCAFAGFVNAIMFLDVYILSKVSKIGHILGYISLLTYIAKSISLKKLLEKYKIPIVVLAIFNCYLIFSLNQMILADIAIEVYTFDFLIECIYNMCILLVLSFSLVNYLYHDSKKGLILFLASVCIVFSEVVQVAYIFVSSEYVLNVVYAVLLVTGFYLVYVYIVSKINIFYKVLF